MKIFILSLVIFILGLFEYINPLREMFLYVFAPLQLGIRETTIDLKNSVDFFINLSEVRTENLELLYEVERLTSEIEGLKVTKEENKILRDQLKIETEKDFSRDIIMAGVLGNPSDITGNTIILDKGYKHGVSIGNNVVVQNYLVGVIKSVFERRSTVNLIVSPEVSITVYDVDAANKTEGLVRGRHGISIELTRVLPEEELKIGDTILSSGKDGVFEPDLIIGKIIEVVEETPAGPLKGAFVAPIVDFSEMRKVFVIL